MKMSSEPTPSVDIFDDLRAQYQAISESLKPVLSEKIKSTSSHIEIIETAGIGPDNILEFVRLESRLNMLCSVDDRASRLMCTIDFLGNDIKNLKEELKQLSYISDRVEGL